MPDEPLIKPTARPLARREFLRLAAGAGAAAVIVSTGWPEGYAFAAGSGGASSLGSGTVPEQVHLTWGADSSSEMTVSWVSPQAQVTPQLVLTPSGGSPSSPYAATAKSYTDNLSGETVYAYHVPLTGLTPGAKYTYSISDAGQTSPVAFSSTFTMAGSGRFPFSFTSFGDLGTPGSGATYTLADGTQITSSAYSESQWNAYNAVGEVENLNPLFHLLNGDLCYADKEAVNPKGASGALYSTYQPAPEVWRDFALNSQRSAANRPWMPCIGNHEAELQNGPYGYASFNTRYLVPDNATSYTGNFYSFRVGSVVFISLDANDVCYQGGGGYNVAGVATTDANGNPISTTAHQYNQFYTGQFGTPNTNGTWTPGSNAQTNWLQSTLASARADSTVDWIVVQMHQCALSSSTDNGCDAGIRQAWLPLFDQYQVDLVVNGHDHDYERTYPVRGFTPNLGTGKWAGGTVTQAGGPTNVPANTGGPVNTFTPNVVAGYSASSTWFDTSGGTVYLTLGGGGTNKRDNAYGSNVANVTTFTQIRTGNTKPGPDSTEPAAWSAKTDTTDAYGVALFSVDPGQAGGNTTITVTYYHAPTQTSGTPNYSPLETFSLTRPRSDNNVLLPELRDPAVVVGGVAAVAGGALYLRQRDRADGSAQPAASQMQEAATGADQGPL